MTRLPWAPYRWTDCPEPHMNKNMKLRTFCQGPCYLKQYFQISYSIILNVSFLLAPPPITAVMLIRLLKCREMSDCPDESSLSPAFVIWEMRMPRLSKFGG